MTKPMPRLLSLALALAVFTPFAVTMMDRAAQILA